ncbi:MAG: hypothetical protein N4A50_01480 [Vallitalea sp.]|jgi:hypothetical protein|nr:hypothetical protein [Vallitalea sp.]
MKIIKNSLVDFYNVQKKFGYIYSINLKRDIDANGCSEYMLDIILCDYPNYEGCPKLLLHFLEVRDFKLGNIEGMFKLLIHITDISERQMEGIKYKVQEEENTSFSFYCNAFEYKILNISP